MVSTKQARGNNFRLVARRTQRVLQRTPEASEENFHDVAVGQFDSRAEASSCTRQNNARVNRRATGARRI
jgi:hypothetical protein